MGQSRFFGEPLTGDSWHSDENNKFQPGEFNTEFDVVIPAPVSRSNVIFDNFLEEQAEQKQAVEDALGDEIANGDINPTDIDNEARKQITEYYKRSEGNQDGKEYLVRGALLRCSCGTNSRKLNLSPCHGVYFKEHPLVHKMDCRQGEEAEDNITWYGVCDQNDLDTEDIVVVNDKGENQTGKKCCPEIIGCWRNTYNKTQIAANHVGFEEYELYDTLTMDSYLICRHGGIITPVDSGQSREVQLSEFKDGQDAYDRVMGQDEEKSAEENIINEEPEPEDNSLTDNDNVPKSDDEGKKLTLPSPGTTITISRGKELPDETAVVSSWNAWSVEYSVNGCNSEYAGETCCNRLNYAVQNYSCNSTEDDLLMFDLEGYDGAVFAGAMVEDYADIGDIVQVTLDDGSYFYFLILDVKNIHHPASDLAGNNQCQCEWGHGYMLSEDTVQLQVCEFITAGNCSVDSAIHAKSGAFLKKRSVVEAQIIDHILICD